MTVLGLWLGWGARLVRGRREMRVWIASHDCTIISEDNGPTFWGKCCLIEQGSGSDLPWVRRMFGEEAAAEIWVPAEMSREDLSRIETTFPEANIEQLIDASKF